MDLTHKVEAVLATLRPMIQQHSGNIELMNIKDGIVYVKLSGACVGCPSSWFTLKLGIEEAVKEQCPEIKEVIPL